MIPLTPATLSLAHSFGIPPCMDGHSDVALRIVSVVFGSPRRCNEFAVDLGSHSMRLQLSDKRRSVELQPVFDDVIVANAVDDHQGRRHCLARCRYSGERTPMDAPKRAAHRDEIALRDKIV